MVIFLATLVCLTICWELMIPTLRRSYAKGQRAAEERMFLIKLRIIRKYYPPLQELTCSEIIEAYDVEALYDNIGR
jgi:hypothetical protein